MCVCDKNEVQQQPQETRFMAFFQDEPDELVPETI